MLAQTASMPSMSRWARGKYVTGGRPTPWVYKDAQGNWHMTHGQRAQPYIKPAVADHAQQYQKIIKSELEDK